MSGEDPKKEDLDRQHDHWEDSFARMPRMFGDAPSEAAQKAAELFKKEGKTSLLELGCGQGRDTLFFAEAGFQVRALDYSSRGIGDIRDRAARAGLSASIESMQHDIRRPLPFEDNSFDACFSHMLYCMALTITELEFLTGEIRRVLKPGGLNIYTVRHTGDAHYGDGIHRGEDMYEMNGYIVHFLSREKVERLSAGFDVADISEFEEGGLPRKLFRVTLRKKQHGNGSVP